MHRFIVDPNQIQNGRAPLKREEAAHALRVLRMKDGDEAQALDANGGAWHAVLRATDSENAYLELLETARDTESPARVTLYMGIPKGEKLEIIAQKLTELGAAKLVPVRMERCVAKIDAKDAEKKLTRLKRIALEAEKQSGRTREMEIAEPMNFNDAVKALASHEVRLVLWEEANGFRLTDAKNRMPDARDIAFVVGPEGGISRAEAEKLSGAGASLVTMGPRILRTETAAVAGCAVIMSLWGDL